LCLQQEKVWKITVQSDSGEVMVDVVGKKTRKQKFICFLHPGNSKKLLGMVRTLKMFQWFCVSEMVKTFDWDKFNPAYMSEVKGTTGRW
jgi:hypothetical protein